MSRPHTSKPVSQDFFPRSASAVADKSKGYQFNKAPINRNEAKEEAKEKVASNKRSAFVARLYQDEEPGRKGTRVENYDAEMRVFDMDDESEGEAGLTKKREAKASEKLGEKPARKFRYAEGGQSKINRLVS